MTKRDFLRGITAGAAVALARPATALAQRVRILPADVDPALVTPAAVSPELQRLLSTVRVGEARHHGPLLVFWLHATPAAPPLPIATLDEARGRGDVLVTEQPQASVPTVIVENRGKIHALLLAGEILLGGKQNRVVTEDTLLPPLSGPRTVAVYCIEQGRWGGSSRHFESKGSFAAPGLRARVMERAEQPRVWAEVGRYAARAAAPSPTGSYQAIYDKVEVQQHQQEVERTLDHRADPDARGAAVFVDQRLAGLDLFDDAGLFARQWPKLLRAHALEAYGIGGEAGGHEPRLRQRVEGLLRSAAASRGVVRRNAGAGWVFEFRVDGGRGAALVAEGRVVHTALL